MRFGLVVGCGCGGVEGKSEMRAECSVVILLEKKVAKESLNCDDRISDGNCVLVV
jgi:hypothetical protein